MPVSEPSKNDTPALPKLSSLAFAAPYLNISLPNPTPKQVIVGMSGGVDSSVTAYLLKEMGFDVTGVFMKNWEEDDGTEYCTAIDDLHDAQLVADRLGIPLKSINFASEYWDFVFEHFLEEYKAGRTPNPDILCNKEIKFKAFLDYAKQLGADAIATGHYAKLDYEQSGESSMGKLIKGDDQNKDQSYFLHAVSGEQLGQSIFPLGNMPKPIVRQIAEAIGLANHAKKDSTGICFIGERRFKDFLNQYLPAKQGDIITDKGEVLGQHDGLMYYTIGQRQGIQLGGVAGSQELPWYVLGKNLAKNQLIIGQGHEHPKMLSESMLVKDIHWINEIPNFPYQCKVKSRYRQADQSCVIKQLSDSLYQIDFEQAQRAIAPGQSAVFYQGDQCLGGGIIEQGLPNHFQAL